MPQAQRLRVWKGDLKKTSGGLTKKDLFKNKRGKIVSRKKSGQASGANNLGNWLRKKGESYQGVPDRVEKKPAAKVKSPKPMIHRPKPKRSGSSAPRRAGGAKPLQPKPQKQAPKPKPKPQKQAPKPKAPPPRRKKSPIKVGQKAPEKKHKISVSNIVKKGKVQPKVHSEEGWPAWAKKQPKLIKMYIRTQKKFMDWDDLKEDVEDEFDL